MNTCTLAVVGDEPVTASVRTCKTCGEERPSDGFYRRSDGHLDLHCKSCVKERMKASGAIHRRRHGMAERVRTTAVTVDGVCSLSCRRCKSVQPVTEFYRNKNSPSGFGRECKRCCRERVNANGTAKRRAAGVRARQYPTIEEKRATRGRWWRERGRTANAQRLREYARREPDRFQTYSARRRALKANAPINDLTPTQWREIKAEYDQRCAYCGKRSERLTQDHVLPLSRGGPHTASNIVPACRSCNSSKRNRTVEEWVAAGGRPISVQPQLLVCEGSGA